jgi:hypothetical protein
MKNIEHYARLEKQARAEGMGALANHWRYMKNEEKHKEMQENMRRGLKDYKNLSINLKPENEKRVFWQEVAGGFILTGIGLLIGYLIAAAF